MHFFRFIIASALFVVLCGCQSQSSKLVKYDPALGKPSALIIAKIDNADYINLKRLDPKHVRTDSTIPAGCTVAPGSAGAVEGDVDVEYTIVHPIIWPVPHKYTDSIYSIEPGTYYISYAYLDNPTDDNAPIRSTRCDGLDSDNKPVYGAFTVREGEVLYLGDIKVNWLNRNPSQMFCMIDNSMCVKRDLTRAGYAELAQKVALASWER
jgi:hypothetical protein